MPDIDTLPWWLAWSGDPAVWAIIGVCLLWVVQRLVRLATDRPRGRHRR